jgi:uncharacterized protein YqjF (DUF2071 family)
VTILGKVMPFLTARWSNLCLFTYAVPAALLEPRLPPGLEFDTRDGQAFVSLVAFDFLDTRVLGVPWPGYRNFAELNLRFYVRRRSSEAQAAAGAPFDKLTTAPAGRGVVFIREFVPQRLVAWMAKAIYNEPYLAAPLVSTVRHTAETIGVEHRLTFGGRTHTLSMTGGKPAFRPEETGVEHFFKEHHWGYGTSRNGRLLRYEVVHPVWEVYPVQSWALDVDFSVVYGAEWGFLADAKPYSMVLAAGSEIKVFPKMRGESPAVL